MSTFTAGDHIRVKRFLYAHHGIFVDDSRVIDFSGGRSIWEKPDALVQARTLKEFEGRRDAAEKIQHPQQIFGGLGSWPEREYPPKEVVRRAEAICRVAATKGAYRLSGSNCEHIANWCKCGAPESKQVRQVHAWHAGISFALLLGIARLPSRWKPMVMRVAVVSALVTIYMQYEAWTTPRRWRPIVAEAELLLRGTDQKPS
jgi:hypothetical protein